MKKGFTLMELLVYMAIVGIIVLVAGEAFSNSTKFRVRTQNMLKATQEAENVATLFKADVSQMGAKSSKEADNADGGEKYGDKFSNVYSDVFIDPDNAVDDKKDSSSFLITSENGFSKLTVRRVRYDNQGHYQAVEEISWFVERGILKRSCRTVAGTQDENACKEQTAEEAKTDAVEIATGVDTFKVIAPKPVTQAEEQIFPPGNATQFKLIPRTGEAGYVTLNVTNSSGEANKGGESAVLSQFFSNYSNANENLIDETNRRVNQVFAIKNEDAALDSWRNMCSNYNGTLTFEKDQEYEIYFEIPVPANSKDKSLMFVPGTDHMSVGFRSVSTGDYPQKDGVRLMEDFLFFPPLDPDKGAGGRSMRFTVPEKVENVCLAFTFACYSPLVSQGTLTIENLKIKKIPGLNYRFDREHLYDPEAHKNDKKNIKALQLILDIARGKKNGGNGETGHVEVVVPTPSNGPRD